MGLRVKAEAMPGTELSMSIICLSSIKRHCRLFIRRHCSAGEKHSSSLRAALPARATAGVGAPGYLIQSPCPPPAASLQSSQKGEFLAAPAGRQFVKLAPVETPQRQPRKAQHGRDPVAPELSEA